MRTLIVVDDLAELLPSKNRIVQFGLRFYIRYLCRQLSKIIKRLGKEGVDHIAVSAPKEILDKLKIPVEKLDYGIWSGKINFSDAGKIAARLSDPFENSKIIRTICPDLFSSQVSVPQIASIRLRLTLCYNLINNYLMLQKIITINAIEKIILPGGASEIEKIALLIARRDRLSAKIKLANHPIVKIKGWFSAYIYHRDRKLHALNSFQHCYQLPAIKPHSSKKIICMLPAHSLHFRMLIPLAQALSVSKSHEAIFLLQDTFFSFIPHLEREKIQYRMLSDFTKSELSREFKQLLAKFSENWAYLKAHPDFQKEFQAEEIDWFSVLKDKLEPYFKFSYTEVKLLQKRLKRAFLDLKPSAVVTVSDARFFDAGGAAVAKELKIPSFLYSQTYLHDTDSINEYDTSDHVLTVGENMKDYIISRGRVNHDRITTVGDVRIELEKRAATAENKLNIKKSLGISSDKKVFIAVSFYLSFNFSYHDKTRFFEMIHEAVQDQSDIMIVVKAHPNENLEMLRKFLSNLGIKNFVVTNEYSMLSLFSIASGLLTLTSLSALEAMAFDVPVIVVALPDRNYDYYIPLRQTGTALCAETSSELAQILRKLVGDPAYFGNQISRQQVYVSRFIDQGNEGASNRIIKILDEKIKT